MPILELHVITGRLVLMYPNRAALRSASPTFSAGSDVSVVIKHEIKFVPFQSVTPSHVG